MEENKSDLQLNKRLMEQQEQKGGINIKWQNVSIEILDPTKNNKRNNNSYKTILHNSTGYLQAGTTLAIMGPSGAGKTTLLNLLAMRLTANKKCKITGEVLMNNNKYSQNEFNNNAAYILQNDILMESLTVRETIEFAAFMKFKGNHQEKIDKVNSIISKLKLEKCQNTYVGGTYIKGISGGERKRTNIGVELVTDPQLLVLDEPTSGLDSVKAQVIVSMLNQLAREENKTILFSIHQPSSEIYNILDRILLLNRFGQTLYQGDANQVVPYLSKQCDINIPPYCNPSDFFMDIIISNSNNINNGAGGNGGGSGQANFSHQNYEKYIYPQVQQSMNNLQSNKPLSKKAQFVNGFWYESQLIAQRSFRNFYRSPVLFRAKVAQLVVMCFITSSIWWMIGDDEPSDQTDVNGIQQWVMNLVGLLFFLGVAMFMNIMMTLVITFPVERGVFLKEENSKSYRVSSYFIGKLLVELPYILLYPILINAVCYWLLSLRVAGFGLCTFILVLMSLTGNGLGLMTGCMFANPQTAMALTPVLLLPFMMFSGYYSNLKNLPEWITWIQYLSPFRYQQNALLINQFDGVNFSGFDPVATLGYDLTLWESIGVLIGLAVGFHTLAMIFLKARANKIN